MDYPWKFGTITPSVRPAGHSTTRHAGASSPALSVLSGPRTRDSVSWRHRASPLNKEVLRFFLPPPNQSLPLFSSLLLVDLGPPPAPSARTTAVRGVYRPAALATGHPVFCASPVWTLWSQLNTVGGGRRIRPCLQQLLPRHVARPGLLVTAHAHLYRPTPRVPGLLVYIILGARLSARTTTDTAARRTRLHVSLPCHPGPVRSTIVADIAIAAAHAHLRRRLPPGTVGAPAATSTAAPRGVDTPFHSIDRPSFWTVIKGTPTFTTSLPAPKRGILTLAASLPCRFPRTPMLTVSKAT